MVKVKWYGTNGLEFQHANGNFMIDPYVSRSHKQLVVPAEQEKYLKGASPDFILMTHAHWDHLPDVPELIRKTGTTLFGSTTACNIMRALKVPEKNLHVLNGGEKLDLSGGVRVTVFESRHMGNIPETDRYDEPPAQAELKNADNWRCGKVLAFLIEIEGIRILNVGSANLLESTMHGLECDYLLCGISRFEPHFPDLLTRNIKYKYLIPTHHDEFTLPLDQFYIRNDLDRMKEVIPWLSYRELKILDWIELEAVGK